MNPCNFRGRRSCSSSNFDLSLRPRDDDPLVGPSTPGKHHWGYLKIVVIHNEDMLNKINYVHTR